MTHGVDVPASGPVEPGPTVPATPGLGRAAGRGATTLMAASLAMRALNFVGQIVLGTLLLDQDFGLFAIASSIAAFVLVLQDGGMQTLVVQRGAGAYDDLEGPAFWLSVVFNMAAAALLALLAPFLARLYGEPALAPMLWMIAAAIPLNSLSAVSMARLRMDMRFGALSAIEAMQGIVRYGGMIAGAMAGLGAMAFVAPLPIVAVLTGIAATLVTRRTPWARPAGVARWSGLLSASGWLIASSLAGSALYLGSLMALGLTASTALVGIYFFGYSFVQQSGHLVISNAERVLLPVMSRLRDESERMRSVVVRSLRAVGILGFSVSAILGSVFAPVENLCWTGKWAAAVGVVRIMAIVYPLFVLHVVARCVVTGQGRFRAHALSVALAGMALMLVSAGAGRVGADPAAVGWIVGTGMVSVSLAYLVWGVRGLGIGYGELIRRVAPITTCALLALLAGILSDDVVHRAILGSFDPLAPSLRDRLIANGLRLVAAGTACAAVLAIGFRRVVPDGLVECFEVLPDVLARPARRWFRL